jgi:retron-type reverse transcriptase
MMDIKGVFPIVNQTYLLYKICQAKMDKNLVQWIDSFMSNHRVKITINGEPSLAIETNTGLPQGSPISPVFFLIYITDLVALIEKEVDRVVGLLFVDDVR